MSSHVLRWRSADVSKASIMKGIIMKLWGWKDSERKMEIDDTK